MICHEAMPLRKIISHIITALISRKIILSNSGKVAPRVTQEIVHRAARTQL